MVNKMSIDLTVNNRAIKAKVPPDLSLMRFLREELGLTGAKNGCDSGHCGTCTVILNGKPVQSCIVKMKMPRVAGCVVETIENLSRDSKLHPLQSAFMIEDAVQCGFCTPGMIMAAKALLDVNQDPSDEEIRRALRDNLCRCTGYVSILDSVHRAARMLASGIKIIDPPKSNINEDRVIGVSVIRKDSLPKVTGETKYADDLYEDDMLVGKVLWSAHTHAEIRSIDTSLAEKMPGVTLVLTSKDVPGENRIGLVRRDQPALAEKKVRSIGDPVAVVFSETEQVAAEAIKKISVDYLPLPGVFSIEEAMSSDAPLIHETGNLCHEYQLEGGDVKRAFSKAAVIIEQTYTTPFIEPAFLEPEAGVAYPTEDGGVIVKIGSQSVVDNRAQLADALALPLEKVRVVHLPVGGAFGAKEDIVLHFFLALGALRSSRPVKMTLSRPESMRVHPKRHFTEMHYKTAASSDGKLLAVDASIRADTGAYSSTGPQVLTRMISFGSGPYYVPNFHLRGEVYFTNNPFAGAMRGFGAPQVTFAMESQMDAMAHTLGLDPFEFRKRNALDIGSSLVSGDILESSVGIKRTIEAAEAALHQITIPKNNNRKIGIGVASGMMNIGFGHGDIEESGAVVELTEEGSIIVRVGLAELGQGGLTVVAQIAAQELSFPYEMIDVIGADTALSPLAGGTAASRQTYLTGNAVIASCKKLKKKIKLFAEEELGILKDLLEIRNGKLINMSNGQVFELSKLGTALKAEEWFRAEETASFAQSAKEKGDQESHKRRIHFAYSYATDVAVVEIEESTGDVKVLKLIAAQDVGRAINPKAVEGQFIGGAVMGMGYGLSEEFKVEQGINTTDTLRKCRIPTIEDLPDVIPIIVEDPEPHGPFGAKGVGETSLVPAAPAITNAIYNAVGARITSLPATKEKILKAIRETRLE
jgi:CO/xanthine dehydrogenase Mo-binding subunit/aerobic-type carbon monoxide dehydrogenase small subunit (CoxS/CutS family)